MSMGKIIRSMVIGVFLLILSFQRSLSYQGHSLDELCRSETTGCGSCLKVHQNCGWCSNMSFEGEFRCDTINNLWRICPQDYLDEELGKPSPYTTLPIQMRPQHVQITLSPGLQMGFQLFYKHLDPNTQQVYLLNSDAGNQGLSISVSSNCSESRRDADDPRGCNGVLPNDILAYNITIGLLDCITAGDAVLSVGVGGLREVVAVYVTPSCGCDCEKFDQHVQNAESCSHHGTMICGKCMCERDRLGSKCEQDRASMTTSVAATAAVTTTTAPRDDCRLNNTYPDCSGRGLCQYGRCVCDRTARHEYTGRYCECGDCPADEYGRKCSGRGHCNCNLCECDSGWSGADCSCSTDEHYCRSSDGQNCYGAGRCICNRCQCHPVDNPVNEFCEPLIVETTTETSTTSAAAETTTFPEQPLAPHGFVDESILESTAEMTSTTERTTTTEKSTTLEQTERMTTSMEQRTTASMTTTRLQTTTAPMTTTSSATALEKAEGAKSPLDDRRMLDYTGDKTTVNQGSSVSDKGPQNGSINATGGPYEILRRAELGLETPLGKIRANLEFRERIKNMANVKRMRGVGNVSPPTAPKKKTVTAAPIVKTAKKVATVPSTAILITIVCFTLIMFCKGDKVETEEGKRVEPDTQPRIELFGSEICIPSETIDDEPRDIAKKEYSYSSADREDGKENSCNALVGIDEEENNPRRFHPANRSELQKIILLQ